MYFHPARNREFADFPLEGNGFEFPVPGFRSSIFYTAPEFGAANALSVYNGKLGNEVEGRLARWLEWCGRRRVVVHRSRSQFARCKVKLTMRAPGIIRAGPARLFAVIVPAMLIPTLLGARLYRIALVEGDDFHAGR
jgi:hypothetical protein